MSILKLPCGCELKIVDGKPQIDYYNLKLDCPLAWKVYQDGYTQSIFQLESYLGKNWSKKLKPSSINDAAALISIIRPGVLQSFDDRGRNLTSVFCERKNDGWEPSDSVLDNLLKDTYGINIYQETSMQLAKEVAGFDGPQQMRLIKGIGKKKADIILGLRKEFIDGCKTVGKVNEEEANLIFDNIEASARYAFNRSHAVGYAETGYWTAWVKSHFPTIYICSWLRNAKNEQKPLEEIRAVISEARRLNIKVKPPSIRNLPATKFFIKKNEVYFGLDSIKGCGEKAIKKLEESGINFEDLSWLDFLVLYSNLLNKTQIINMIRTGCFDYTNIERSACEYEYNQFNNLSITEKKKAAEIYEKELPLTLINLIVSLIPTATSRRKLQLEAIRLSLLNPSSSLKDSKENIIAHEKELMGINISCSAIDKATMPTCVDKTIDVDSAEPNTEFILVGEIGECREIKIKKGNMVGQIMLTMQLTDEYGSCDCVMFPREYSYYEGATYDSNVILIKGKKSNRGGIIVEKVYEI